MGCTTSTRCATKTALQGSYVFRISRYSRRLKRLGLFSRITSPVFAVGGYYWKINFYPYEDYVVVCLSLDWLKNKYARVRASAQFSLLDSTGTLPPHTITAEAKEFSYDSCLCCIEYKKRSELEGSPYLHKDRLTIECTITIAAIPEVAVPPSNIADHLGKLLQGKENADVTFVVGGEDFPAHKTVLAMRSPVFKAQLYGAMREKDTSRIIMRDMQPAVFDALLHFVYTDSLPAMDHLGRKDYIETFRHLLVAADRYAMERMKLICESILCKNIDAKTVMNTIFRESQFSVVEVEVPPSDITEHLGKLLQGKEDTDVTFHVGGEAFPAHKTVLAMRSPVFKAQLYGAMREKDMSRVIIGDMQPAVFDALLHFIYTDSLPAMDNLDSNDYIETIRHMLVAADRYAMERLKVICESILCKNIDAKTVMTTIALADQHHCDGLIDACVHFMASLGTKELDGVMASQGYAEFKSTFPLTLVELWEKKGRLGKVKP